MKRLEDLSFKHRIAITFGIVMAVLFGLALIGYLSGGWEAQGEVIHPTKYDARMDALQREALDEAFVGHFVLLFSTWMKDPNYGPSRAKVGAAHARKAYADVMDEIESREQGRSR